MDAKAALKNSGGRAICAVPAGSTPGSGGLIGVPGAPAELPLRTKPKYKSPAPTTAPINNPAMNLAIFV
jgi:hypothetical protein